MLIKNIGGATAVLEHKGIKFLFDPWMADGIMHGSWFHWPELNVKIEEIADVDYIFISHIHEDHCSPETLEKINKRAEIIIMDREPEIPNLISRILKNYSLNFKKVHKVKPFQKYPLNEELSVELLTADKGNELSFLIDSAIVISWGDFVIYNANDCVPHSATNTYINQNYKRLDLALLPYAGGSGYPACYSNLTHSEKILEKSRIFNQRLNDFKKNALDLNATYVLPFADQYVIGGSRIFINEYLPHPPCPGDVLKYINNEVLKNKILLLNSGQSFDLDKNLKIPNEPYISFTEDQRNKYLNKIRIHLYDHEKVKFRDSVPILKILKIARSKLWTIQQNLLIFPGTTLFFNIKNLNLIYKLDFSSEFIEHVQEDSYIEPYLELKMTSTLLVMCLINHISWNMGDQFIDYKRVPNNYEYAAYRLLNYLTI